MHDPSKAKGRDNNPAPEEPEPLEMTNQHTPGPWVADAPTGTGFDRQISIRHQTEACSGGAILTLWTLHRTPTAQATQDANARLIAAAPDLLARLEESSRILCSYARVVDDSGDGEQGEAIRRHIAQNRAAIAKAKGEA